MLSASFYGNANNEVGHLTLTPTGQRGAPGGEHEYEVKWIGLSEEEDIETTVTRYGNDRFEDLFAMALVEVSAIRAERAVN